MSLFQSLLQSLTGKNDSGFTPPHALCPGDCPLGPEQCEKCLPYKQRLQDALYNVDHLEDFLSRYVVGAVSTGTTECPHCGAPSADPFVCEYCGLQIQPDDGKIRVASANDIPDPILEARDIIYERHSDIVAAAQETTGGGLLSGLLDLLDGDDGNELGSRMSKEEIQQAAEAYGVSVSSYLNGFDNGKYLNWEKKQAQDSASQHSAADPGLGLAGGAVFSGVMSGASHPRPPVPPRPPQRPTAQHQSVHGANRPAARPQQPSFPQRPQQTLQSLNRPQQPQQNRPSSNRPQQPAAMKQDKPAARPAAAKEPAKAKEPQRRADNPKDKGRGGPQGGNSIHNIKR